MSGPVAAWKATWRRLARTVGVVQGVGLNDLWADRASDLPAVLAARRPAWVGIQEGKNSRYRDLVDRDRYGVVQRMKSGATKGVAIIYDRRQFKALGSVVDDPRYRGLGWQELTPAGHGILARGVAWRDVRIAGPLGPGRIVRLASTHRPPKWAGEQIRREFDRALDAWLAASPIPVWLVLDANERDIAKLRFRGRKRFVGIDGHVITRDLRYADQKARRLVRRTSDHAPVAALVRVPLHRRSPR